MKTNRYENISDNELLDYYYQSKDQQWIGILLERYTMLLLGVCMKYLKNEEEARDAVQQIFLKVLTEVSKYKIDYFYCILDLICQKMEYIDPSDFSKWVNLNAAQMQVFNGKYWSFYMVANFKQADLRPYG